MSDTLTFYDLEFHYSSGRDEVITFMAGRGSFEMDEHEYRVTRQTDDGEATITVQRDKLDSYGVTKRVEKAPTGYESLQTSDSPHVSGLSSTDPAASARFWASVKIATK